MKFEVGTIYIDSKSCELILCSETNEIETKFYFIEDKVTKKVNFLNYADIFLWKTDIEQFNNMLFFFASSCNYSDKFYKKIIEPSGGSVKPYVTTNTNYIIYNNKSEIMRTTRHQKDTIKKNNIIFLNEIEFWKIYYNISE